LERLRDGAARFEAFVLGLTFGIGRMQGEEALHRVATAWPWLGVIVFDPFVDETQATRCRAAGAIACISISRTHPTLLASLLHNALARNREQRRQQILRAEFYRVFVELCERSAANPPPAPPDGGPAMAGAPGRATPRSAAAGMAAARPVESVMRELYVSAFERHRGNMFAAAVELGVPYTSYRRKLRELGITARPRHPRP
jgi:DNA-binding NtrC family response regulator